MRLLKERHYPTTGKEIQPSQERTSGGIGRVETEAEGSSGKAEAMRR